MAYNAAAGLPFTAVMGPATNPPLLLWFYTFLAACSPTVGFWIFVAVEVISLFVIFAVSGTMLGRRLAPAQWCLAVGLTACSMPMFHHFWFTQVQLPLLAIIMAGVYLWQRGATAGACGLLTLAGALKLYPMVIAPFPLLMARPGQFKRTALLWLAFLAFWVALPGITAWESFARHAVPYLNQFSNGRYLTFSIPSFINGLLALRLGQPPRGAAIGSYALVVLALMWAWWRCWQTTSSDAPDQIAAGVALLLVTTVLCSAVAWVHYLVFLIVPLLCLAAETHEATGLSRLRLGALLVVNLAAINLAGTVLIPHGPVLLRYLVANAPVLGMVFLFAHFARSLHRPLPRGA